VSEATDRAFAAALTFSLAREGCDLAKGDTGYVNNPRDPGGATNYGIIERVYHEFRQRNGLERRPVKEIEYSEVELIYRRNYWRDAKCEEIAEARPKLALCHFDWAVNGGTGRARLYLQAALGVTVDSIIGPATLEAAKECDEVAVCDRYLDLRAAHYRVRVANPDADEQMAKLVAAGLEKVAPTPNATQVEFLAGWLARCRWVARETGVTIAQSYAKPVAA
jgi:lysozyme family protein